MPLTASASTIAFLILGYTDAQLAESLAGWSVIDDRFDDRFDKHESALWRQSIRALQSERHALRTGAPLADVAA